MENTMTIKNGMDFMEVVKELDKLTSVHAIVSLGNATDWYFARESLNVKLTEKQETAVADYAYDLYMDSKNIPQIRIMDELVNRINNAEDVNEYIETGMYDEDFCDIMEECYEY